MATASGQGRVATTRALNRAYPPDAGSAVARAAPRHQVELSQAASRNAAAPSRTGAT